MQELNRIAADRIHFRMELDRQHSVAEINKTRSRIPLNNWPAVFGRFEYLQVWRRRWQATVAKPITAGAQHVVEQWGYWLLIADCFEHLANSNGVPRLEWSQFPAKAPSHGAIDVIYRVGNCWRNLCAVDERQAERAPKKRTDLVFSQKQAFYPGADIPDGPAGVQCRKVDRRFRPI